MMVDDAMKSDIQQKRIQELEQELASQKLREFQLLKNEKKNRSLIEFGARMIDLPDLNSIYESIVRYLESLFPNTLILYVSIDEKNESTCFEKIVGIPNSLLKRALNITGYSPIGRHFKLIPSYNERFRSGRFMEFEGGLTEFAAAEFPKVVAVAVERLIGIHKIYTIGIKKNENLLAAIHFITFNKKEIEDVQFIEDFVRQVGVILQKKIAEISLIESEKNLQEVNKKLKEFNETNNKLFSIIAHDLRSPFNSILGYSEILSRHVLKFDKEKIEDFANIIRLSAKSTLMLLENLLSWSKTQTNRITFRPDEIRLKSITDQVITLLESTAKIKNISIRDFTSADLLVFADENMLVSILQNLLSNAVKYSYPEGVVEIHANAAENGTEIHVRDYGVGILDEVTGHLFGKFGYTSKGTANEKGSGLGLLLCKEFVDKHGGRIYVVSEPGQGSDFVLSLPEKHKKTGRK